MTNKVNREKRIRHLKISIETKTLTTEDCPPTNKGSARSSNKGKRI